MFILPLRSVEWSTTAAAVPWSRKVSAGEVLAVGPHGGELRPLGESLELNRQTHSTLWVGAAARRYLHETEVFQSDHVLLHLDGTPCEIAQERGSCLSAETGAWLVSRGVKAKISVEGDDCVLVRTERAPGWFRFTRPRNFAGFFPSRYDRMVLNNRSLRSGRVFGRADFGPSVGASLEAAGFIVREAGTAHGCWRKGLTSEELVALSAKSFSMETSAALVDSFERSKQQKLMAMHGGRIPADLLSPEHRAWLQELNLIGMADGEWVWNESITESEFKSRLSGKPWKQQRALFRLWRSTSRAGRDRSGTAFEDGGVRFVSARTRMNPWDGTKSEWLSSSDFDDGQDGLVDGISVVERKDGSVAPVAFSQLRRIEVLHKHPRRFVCGEQTEVYVVLRGTAVLVTMQGENPTYNVLEKGSVAVIEPETVHSVVAVSGDYRHASIQTPSTFQHGFAFKKEVPFEHYGLVQSKVEALTRELLEALQERASKLTKSIR